MLVSRGLVGCCWLLAAAAHARVWVVDNRAANASDSGAGTLASPLKTVQTAAALARPDDTVDVYPGIYRERIAPVRGGAEGRPITYRAVRPVGAMRGPAAAVLRGSDELPPEEWTRVPPSSAGLWRAAVPLGRLEVINGTLYNPYALRLGYPATEANWDVNRTNGSSCMFGHTLGQLFEGGRPLWELGSVAALHTDPAPGRWAAEPGGRAVVARFFGGGSGGPTGLVELTVRSRVFAPHTRGLGFITVQGFTIEHGANQFPDAFWQGGAVSQSGILGTRSGYRWLIRNNTVRHAKTVGLDIGDEGGDNEGSQPAPRWLGNHTIVHNDVSDNGGSGIQGALGGCSATGQARRPGEYRIDLPCRRGAAGSAAGSGGKAPLA